MTFENLIALCSPLEVSGPKPEEIGMLTQDSRKVEPGAVFIAVPGLQTDGHEYLDEAVAAGASVVITEKPYASQQVCVVQAGSTRTLVGPLAQAFEGFPADELKLIGITGTNGKTTVATLLFQVLQEMGVKAGLLGTVEKRIGDRVLKSRLTTADPVELASDMGQMVKEGIRYLVMEVSSHALDQQRTHGLHFDVAAFTNLSHDHLDYHETFEAYAASKKQLFDALPADNSAVVNADDEQAAYMTKDFRGQALTFGFEQDADYPCEIVANRPEGLKVKVGEEMIESPLVGRFNAYNVVEAYLICQRLGFDQKKVVEALKSATGAEGRLERIEGSGDGRPLVWVDYAHTPDALANVLQTLKELANDKQRLHVIFGCGGDRDKTKRPKMAEVAEQVAGWVTVTSDNPRNEDPDAIIEDIMEGFVTPARVQRIVDREEAIRQTIMTASEATLILIAGKGHETYQEIQGERRPFDDREIARQALKDLRFDITNNGVH